MGNAERKHLLNAEQMARFVSDGYLLLPEMVPAEYNEAVYAEQRQYSEGSARFWTESKRIQDIFELPQVKGALQSFVGPNPVYDHSFMHIVKPEKATAQNWHQDSVIDTRPYGFDVQAFYFSHDTPIEMGPTIILPGSHLRKVSNFSIGRYKNIVGQKQLACKAGTIAILHHGIWHAAMPNATDRTRYVFKLRLRPGCEQRNLFNTDGYDSKEVRDIIYNANYPWQGDESRNEHILRAKLWRYVTGNNSIDVSFEGALTRMQITS
ncbi:phytanoyl-CoA dioxygenase family protein [Paenibacillus sp. y28]|uniref:phytanoyl-CoA dioxygenase family protein n=1 Tax=Paenibacillus sp. y28 TaxID=3129110 RepID=UPI00301B322C